MSWVHVVTEVYQRRVGKTVMGRLRNGSSRSVNPDGILIEHKW